MTQKWNLQDIRPVEPRKRKPHRAADTLNTKAQANEYAPVDREDIPSVVIENDTKKAGNRFLVSIILVKLLLYEIALFLSFHRNTKCDLPDFFGPNKKIL